MLFYYHNIQVTDFKLSTEQNGRRQFSPFEKDTLKTIKDFNKREESNDCIFLDEITDDKVCFYTISDERQTDKRKLIEFADMLAISYQEIETEEVELNQFMHSINNCDDCGYIEDEAAFLESLSIHPIIAKTHYRLDDNVIKGKTKAEVTKSVKQTYCQDLTEEINRIYANPKDRFYGHPVHYILSLTKNSKQSDNVITNLLEALYQSNRIKSKRYIKVELDSDKDRVYAPETIYDIYKGCTVILNIRDDSEDPEYCSRIRKNVQRYCKAATQYANEVLTIILVDKAEKDLINFINDNLIGLAMVKIEEGFVNATESKKYLKKLAEKDKVEPDKALYQITNDKKRSFYLNELDTAYNGWYSKKLRTDFCSEYETIETNKEKLTQDEKIGKGFAYDEMMNMIGLENAKQVINDALSYYKAQKLFKNKGFKNNNTSMHMVFTGNPGTAKTTVARLFAEIMKDNGILSNGILHEVGRADLVGQYVGHTAPRVKDAFKRAKGGVLFIDEAYSLLDDKKGLYGDEAINTIVQEMENNRDNMIVIFAGYPDEMADFLSRNPGLSSRIAFHVDFDNYTPGELVNISKLIAKRQGYEIDESANETLLNIYNQAIESDDFGNGRYARNVVEKARMKQASRLLTLNFEDVTTDDVVKLKAEDFTMPQKLTDTSRKKIGFIA